jgi:hypothetical protein
MHWSPAAFDTWPSAQRRRVGGGGSTHKFPASFSNCGGTQEGGVGGGSIQRSFASFRTCGGTQEGGVGGGSIQASLVKFGT